MSDGRQPRGAPTEGLVAILPTPLRGGEVDEAGVAHLVGACAERSLDGALVLGSNGEYPYLRFEARCRVMRAAAEAGAGRIPVIGTASASGTEEAVALARAAKAAGCGAVLAAVPAYFALEVGHVVRHLEAVAREGGLPVFFYHFPEVTGLRLRPRDFEAIAAVDGVVGTKLTVANTRYLRAVVARTRATGFRVFTGTTFLLEPCVTAGGAGVFCPLPLLLPDRSRAVHDAARAGERDRARALQRKLLAALPLFTGMAAPARLQALGFRALAALPYTGPGPRPHATHPLLKEALRLAGHPISAKVMPPYAPATAAQRTVLERTLRRLDALA